MNQHEYVNETGEVPKQPYEVKYGNEIVVETDVLIVGGGVAGCRAAIEARRKGATVAVADRGFSKRSGAGVAGVDHWHGAVRNPCSKITPEMYSQAAMDTTDGCTNGLARYIVGMEGWDTVLEAEEIGVQIRDEDDEIGNLNPVHLENGEAVSRYLSVNYHLQEPYAPTLEENYRRYAEV